jgi:hypothetical protein
VLKAIGHEYEYVQIGRMGYSVFGSEVIVPDPPCAPLVLGGATKQWENEVLFFDDSYEHEVWNNCTSERVVMQLQIKHPSLAAIMGAALFNAGFESTSASGPPQATQRIFRFRFRFSKTHLSFCWQNSPTVLVLGRASAE